MRAKRCGSRSHALDSLYRLTIVERELMEQKVTVNPDALFGDIATTGHAVRLRHLF